MEKVENELAPENQFLTDMTLAQLEAAMAALIPIVKLEQGKFMIGTEKKQVLVKNEKLIVRIGGGFEPMETHIDHIARPECLKISFQMR